MRLFASAVVISLLLAIPSFAQFTPQGGTQAEVLAIELGGRDGRTEGLRAGHDVGLDQARVRAWMSGFRQGLDDSSESWRVRDAWSRGERDGRVAGHPAGFDSGLSSGGQQAATAYARLAGRPAYLPPRNPERPHGPPTAPAFSACDEPSTITLPLGGRNTTRIRPSTCEREESPLPWATPRPAPPAENSVSDLGRREGLSSGEELAEFVHVYRRTWREYFEYAFETERATLSRFDEESYQREGRRAGAAEHERREACAAHASGFESGYLSGHDDGFAAGFEQGWRETAARHDSSAVLILETAELVDVSGDGVIEPGEGLRLDLSLANAGMVATAERLATWRGARGIVGTGGVEGTLAPQTRRHATVELGACDPGAPYGSTVSVLVQPEQGAPRAAEHAIGRPIVIDGVSVDLAAPDGSAVLLVRVTVACIATADTDRGATVEVAGSRLPVGRMAAGSERTLEFQAPAPASLAGPIEGMAELRADDGTFWMRRGASADVPMHRLVQVAGQLSEPAPAVAAIAARLSEELSDAQDDKKLYKRERAESDLAEYAASLPGLPAATRALLEREVSAPLLAQVDAKGTPRAVRRAVRDALGQR